MNVVEWELKGISNAQALVFEIISYLVPLDWIGVAYKVETGSDTSPTTHASI